MGSGYYPDMDMAYLGKVRELGVSMNIPIKVYEEIITPADIPADTDVPVEVHGGRMYAVTVVNS